VLALLSVWGPDVVATVRDPEVWSAFRRSAQHLVHPDCLSVPYRLDSRDSIYHGLEGLRSLWLEWLAPWASYRVEVDEVFDLGDRVLLLAHDYGRRAETDVEVMSGNSALFVLEDGLIVRVGLFVSHDDGRRAAGLEE
jgi:hypothetical protein